MNFLQVNIDRNYVADQDKVSFFTQGGKKVDITGFTTSNVRVFDTTFEGSPVFISNVSLVNTIRFTAKIPSGRMMVGYAVEDTAAVHLSLTQNLPSTLSAISNSADMLIVSHSSPAFSQFCRGLGYISEEAATVVHSKLR